MHAARCACQSFSQPIQAAVYKPAVATCWHISQAHYVNALPTAACCCAPLLPPQHLRELVTPSTKLISLVHVSNMLGAVLDVEAVVDAARSVGAKVLLDACQSVPHMAIDVRALGVDWIVASGHKAMAPTGIGFLWGRCGPGLGWDDRVRRAVATNLAFECGPGLRGGWRGQGLLSREAKRHAASSTVCTGLLVCWLCCHAQSS